MYRCSNCTIETETYRMLCPACSRWGTFYHVRADPKPAPAASGPRRYSTGSAAIDSVLGGGLVKGALYLLGGDPGAGKSTLLLQIAILFSQDRRAAYVTSEETARMIQDRAGRVSSPEDSAALAIAEHTDVDELIERFYGSHLFVDSLTMLQTGKIKSGMGTPNQAKACVHALMTYARETERTVVMIGQVVKDGGFAGPKMVEHLVDCLLYLELIESGEGRRLAVKVKNRYGRSDLACELLMTETGFQDAGNEPVESGPASA